MKLSISMHDDVVARITERAKRERRSRSNMIELIVLEYMEKQQSLPVYVPLPPMAPQPCPDGTGVPYVVPCVVTSGGSVNVEE